VSETFIESWRRIGLPERHLFLRFGKELGIELEGHFPEFEDVKPDELEDPLAMLEGKYVALYSLEVSAIKRAKVVLGDCVNSLKIEVFHDKSGGSPALKRAAENADIFVSVTRAAKHAATEFIKSHRPPEAPIIRPAGKGTASVLRDLREYLEGIRSQEAA
jgi:uncharacterized protein YdcH (DUF465 family)